MVRNFCPNCRQVEEVGEVMCSKVIPAKQTRFMASTGIRTSSNFKFTSKPHCQNTHSSCASRSLLGTKCRCQIYSSNSNSTTATGSSSKLRSNSYKPVRSELKSFINSGWKTFTLALTVTVFLLFFPATMSSPLPGNSESGEHLRHHKDRTRIHERPAKWINPCRIPSTVPTLSPEDSEADIQTVSDKVIYRHIMSQVTKALKQAREFKEDFKMESFGEEKFELDDLQYDWLKDIMEVVNGDLNEDTPLYIPVEETIKNLYRGLQKFAVGLEAIVLDQACYGGSFYQHFNEAEYQLKYVLCELQIAMLEKNISYEDITRDVMAQEFRDMPDRTTRNIRDWTIFRDYFKTLKYVEKAFHFYSIYVARDEPLATNRADLRS